MGGEGRGRASSALEATGADLDTTKVAIGSATSSGGSRTRAKLVATIFSGMARTLLGVSPQMMTPTINLGKLKWYQIVAQEIAEQLS